MSVVAGLSVLALMFSLSVQAAVYRFDDAGAVPQGGTSLSFEHVVTDDPGAIGGMELVLTFSSSWHLDPGGSINGALILDPGGTGATTTYETFHPLVSPPSAGGQQIHLTFPAGGNFNGCDLNGTWALNLWDKGTDGIQNSLVSWSLEPSGVTSVPEPVNVALGIVAGVWLLATSAWRWPVASWKNGWRTGGAP